WQQNDKEALKPLTQPQFFDAGLAPADLRQMPLPASYDLVGNVEVKLLETYADVVVNDADRTVRLTLNHNDAGEGHYEVANVTIYDLEKKQTLSLSSALTAVPVADLFMESLRQRDQK